MPCTRLGTRRGAGGNLILQMGEDGVYDKPVLITAGFSGLEAMAADRAGLLVGDVLLAVAGKPLGEAGTLLDAVAQAGEVVSLRVMRGGKIIVMEVRLEESGRAA